MSANHPTANNKKKYSNSLFIENDEFDCFVGNYEHTGDNKTSPPPSLQPQPHKNPLSQLSEEEDTEKELIEETLYQNEDGNPISGQLDPKNMGQLMQSPDMQFYMPPLGNMNMNYGVYQPIFPGVVLPMNS
jgi:hypothetical protein